jgi:uridine kinase
MQGPSQSVVVVGIAGGTGAGKTTIARHLIAALPEDSARLIQHDSYYRDHPELSLEQRNRLNFDHPDALDTDLLVDHLIHLRSGNHVDVPIYDFKAHRRQETYRRIEPAPVIIVEGILAFENPHLREQFDVKLFVDTAPDVRVIRRFSRDIHERGRTFELVRQQYYRTVRPMHVLFVEPSKAYADLIVPEGGENKVALDIILAHLRRVC